MPIYNGEEYLEKACLNLSKQTLKDIELICIDDGSTDNSLNLLNKLKNEYNFIKIIKQKNQGSGIARNQGLDEATGEYIAFLDADDIFVDNDALEKMYDYGSKHDADMIGANQKRVSLDGKIEDNFNYKENNYMYFSDYDIINPEEYGIPWAFYKNIFKRSFLNKNNIRFPDLKRGQDPVFLAEILTKIDEIYVVCTDLYGYNYAASGGANSKVNSYHKKFDYMTHYKMTFKILEDAHFDDMATNYKKQLIKYLKLKNNRNDEELFDVVNEVFEVDKKTTLENLNNELLYLQLHLIDSKDKKSYINSIQPIKNKLYYMSMNNIPINYEVLDKYLSITTNSEYSLVSEDLEVYQLNEDIKNSKGWRYTKPIRKSKALTWNVLRKVKNKLVMLW